MLYARGRPAFTGKDWPCIGRSATEVDRRSNLQRDRNMKWPPKMHILKPLQYPLMLSHAGLFVLPHVGKNRCFLRAQSLIVEAPCRSLGRLVSVQSPTRDPLPRLVNALLDRAEIDRLPLRPAAE
jgi:hypothetical protein